MRVKRISTVLSAIVTASLLVSCSSNSDNSYASSVIESHPLPTDSEQAQSFLEPTEDTPPPSVILSNSSLPTQYNTVREMKAVMEASEAPDIPPSEVMELQGLPDGFREVGLERNTPTDYYIIYAKDNFDSLPIAFRPFGSEALLEDEMRAMLMHSGTYEFLSDNTLVSNIMKTDIAVSKGTMYKCTYDTSKKVGLKLRYHEYTDDKSGIKYVISNSYYADGVIWSSKIFVYNGAYSFSIGSDIDMSLDDAMKLHSVPVE